MKARGMKGAAKRDGRREPRSQRGRGRGRGTTDKAKASAPEEGTLRLHEAGDGAREAAVLLSGVMIRAWVARRRAA